MNIKDRVRGSLIGGAAGDALGYIIEFSRESTIFRQYGEKGVRRYRISPNSHKAIISDDTQMTLFTAAAMIVYDELKKTGLSAPLRDYANIAYQDWLITQEMTYEEASTKVIKDSPDYPDGFISVVIKDVPELFQRRAPGLTCLNALQTRREQRINHEHIDSYIKSKINNSKGCGSVMRIAPLGMIKKRDDIAAVAIEAAECAAITHCHPLGYLSSAVLAEIIYRILYNDDQLTLKEIVEKSMGHVAEVFRDEKHLDELVNIIDKAVKLSENDDTDLNNIHQLGEGWIAEEALAIAIYCALKYQDDFSECIITAVNHNGDSDSTGAIAGNILGAYIGYDAIDNKWKEELEIAHVITDVADLLADTIE
ncbi:ADP-ribosylglycohydrolase family protein [uncultured Ruminococcus sp.]|uniref:ADP-ribosylglycohydrolase family protein n=1 Tax=uncultured Ruminococcus sp. TaxID=165186 RepID=UPI00292ED7B4|nr:ADP-ribosylglycohydrolase family protein [uncultured Ruminococcus sp.]